MRSQYRLFSIASIISMLSVGIVHADTNAKTKTNTNVNSNATSTQSTAQDVQQLEQEVDMVKLSEALGHVIGKGLDTSAVKFDLESVIKGMRDGAAGKPSPMSEKEYETALMQIQEKTIKALSESNLKAANEFMTKNAKETGVVEVEPGKIQYMVIQQGHGTPVGPHSKPLINYNGKLLNGEVFSSSEQSGGPITLPLEHTIPGFSKGLTGMKEGEKRRLFLHPDAAYGTMGQLPPNSLLIFEVEIVKADTTDEKEGDNVEQSKGDSKEKSKPSDKVSDKAKG